MSAELTTVQENNLREVLAYVSSESCACEGGSCVVCKAERLLRALMPSMTRREAVKIVASDLLPAEREHWRSNGCPRNHHYLALTTLIQTAESLPF